MKIHINNDLILYEYHINSYNMKFTSLTFLFDYKPIDFLPIYNDDDLE